MPGHRHSHGDDEPGPLDRIRATIASIDEQRRTAAANAGAALVNQAEVERALREQLGQLGRARAEIENALATAEQAAAGAREDQGELAALPYDLTADSLRTALDVVAASSAQLTGLHDVSQTNIARARELLGASRHSLDAALRDQVALLVRLERVHRKTLVAQARADRARAQQASGRPD